ncbi:TonB-linked outer membrane protein, SusC/RagA family [Sphingobacterium nematocida]|uniref:TonB-linked outer membrane protein, SusC/RagA family n=1 Tax=Sphingobacterium nematocida TaxID=1513896 RepID=A0A1T5GH94_9SPHI|nr:SusC/RagA family TonB-linked outer membrane protein [Sphingobacterium nematocida]SKC07687.1 TonB-linked outer membrane protein, SusC/RagA family [Sphingobacterium nematocida]
MKRLTFIFLLLNFLVLRLEAQELTVTGSVKSSSGENLSGVSITNMKTKKAISASNAQGRFSVKVPVDTRLSFKILGHEAAYITVEAGKTNYTVVMDVVDNTLDEAVVVGYVARKKSSLTGSAVVISGKEIQDVPVANFTDLLQGKVPGMNVQLNNGTPGMRGSVAIRGISTLNVQGSGDDAFLTPTSPLYVIDGVPIDEGTNYEYGFQTSGPGISPIAMIPVEDIEDIVVLKDAQATALYGSKGAYGVILVNTKRGKSKIPLVSYVGQVFVNTPPNLRNVLGGAFERRARVNQIMQNDTSYFSALDLINSTPILADSLNPFYNNSTNWQSYFFRTTMNTSHTVNVSGGDQTFNYKIAPGYYSEKGIVENTGFTRYSLPMNMQYRPSDRFRLFVNLGPSMAKNSTGSGNAFKQTGVASSGNTSSLLPSPSLFAGSVDALSALSMVNDNKTGNLNSQVELEYSPVDGLRFLTTMSYNYKIATQDRFLPEALNSNATEVFSYNDKTNTLYNRNMITYTKTLKEKHMLSAYVFNEAEVSKFRADVMQLTGTPNDQIRYGLSYNTRASKGGTLKGLYERRTLGYAGNFTYNYDSKYIVEFSYRLDGTSTTGASNPWSNLPSIGARWNFKDEPFFRDWSALEYGLIRGSWGKNIIPTGTIYDVYGRYTADSQTYNNQPSVTLDMGVIPNISLLPQTTTTLNGAIEFGFTNGLTFLYENYYKQSDQILRTKEIANINAFGSVNTNETSLVNMGHEFIIGYRPRKTGDWSYSLNFNGAFNKDYAAALPDNVRQLLVTDNSIYNQAILYRLGINSLSNVLLHYKGVYASDADVPVNPLTGLRYRVGGNLADERFFQAGDPIWTDLNGDYVLDENDLVVVGNSQPVFTGGFNAFMQFKNWSLNTQFFMTFKRDVLNNAMADKLRNYSNPMYVAADDRPRGALVPISDLDIWSLDNLDGTYPNVYDFRRYTFINPFNYNQTLFQEDGSYFKFTTATLSYNFDRGFVQRNLGITSARVYFSANNIFTISKYSGPDPELVSALGRDSSAGYPNRRSYTLGVNVQF